MTELLIFCPRHHMNEPDRLLDFLLQDHVHVNLRRSQRVTPDPLDKIGLKPKIMEFLRKGYHVDLEKV